MQFMNKDTRVILHFCNYFLSKFVPHFWRNRGNNRRLQKLRNEELHGLHSSPNIIKVIML